MSELASYVRINVGSLQVLTELVFLSSITEPSILTPLVSGGVCHHVAEDVKVVQVWMKGVNSMGAALKLALLSADLHFGTGVSLNLTDHDTEANIS